MIFFCIASSGLFWHFRKVLRQEELERSYVELQIFSKQSSQTLKAMLDDSLNHMKNVAERMTLVRGISIDEIQERLQEESIGITFCYIGIADTTGLAKTTANIQADVKEEDFFKEAINGVSSTSKLIKQPLLYEYEFVNAVPIYQNGKITGVLYGAIDVESFSETMRNIIGNKQYYFGIVEQNGDFIINPNQETHIDSEKNFWQDMSQTNLLENDIDQMKINMGQNKNEIMDYILSGEQRYLYYMPYEINDWYMICIMDPETMDAKLYKINTMVWQLV